MVTAVSKVLEWNPGPFLGSATNSSSAHLHLSRAQHSPIHLKGTHRTEIHRASCSSSWWCQVRLWWKQLTGRPEWEEVSRQMGGLWDRKGMRRHTVPHWGRWEHGEPRECGSSGDHLISASQDLQITLVPDRTTDHREEAGTLASSL